MSSSFVAVEMISNDRFTVTLVDGTGVREMLMGAEGTGFTEAELRVVLSERYGMSPAEIDAAIAKAHNARLTI